MTKNILLYLLPDLPEQQRGWHNITKEKSARFAGTFSLRALRAARFARKFERA